jgi:hypothetical protein
VIECHDDSAFGAVAGSHGRQLKPPLLSSRRAWSQWSLLYARCNNARKGATRSSDLYTVNGTMLNPSHLLIARNGPLRSPAEPHITSTPNPFPHPASSSLLNQSASSGRSLGLSSNSHDGGDSIDQASKIDIHPTFRKDCPLPGTIKVVVQGEVFWCHKEILYFASPFFEAILSGE